MARRYSEEEFDANLPRLASFSDTTIDVARRVLVDGVRPIDVAKERGWTKQRVNGPVARVTAAIERVPMDWELVEIWLPPDEAQQVRERSKKLRAALDNG